MEKRAFWLVLLTLASCGGDLVNPEDIFNDADLQGYLEIQKRKSLAVEELRAYLVNEGYLTDFQFYWNLNLDSVHFSPRREAFACGSVENAIGCYHHASCSIEISFHNNMEEFRAKGYINPTTRVSDLIAHEILHHISSKFPIELVPGPRGGHDALWWNGLEEGTGNIEGKYEKTSGADN